MFLSLTLFLVLHRWANTCEKMQPQTSPGHNWASKWETAGEISPLMPSSSHCLNSLIFILLRFLYTISKCLTQFEISPLCLDPIKMKSPQSRRFAFGGGRSQNEMSWAKALLKSPPPPPACPSYGTRQWDLGAGVSGASWWDKGGDPHPEPASRFHSRCL